MILVSKRFIDFTLPAVLKNSDIIEKFKFSSFIKNKYSVLFFWPMDFTFVCPSELISFNNKYLMFKKKNVKIVGVSFDSVFTHLAWRKKKIHKGGIGKLKYPMVSDIKRKVIKKYGVEHPTQGIALRASFLIDKSGIIRHQVINDLPLGRNINEMLRMIDCLQFHEQCGEVCPAQWEKGKDGIIPTNIGISKFLKKNSINL